jgi:hypothetical protein
VPALATLELASAGTVAVAAAAGVPDDEDDASSVGDVPAAAAVAAPLSTSEEEGEGEAASSPPSVAAAVAAAFSTTSVNEIVFRAVKLSVPEIVNVPSVTGAFSVYVATPPLRVIALVEGNVPAESAREDVGATENSV